MAGRGNMLTWPYITTYSISLIKCVYVSVPLHAGTARSAELGGCTILPPPEGDTLKVSFFRAIS